MEGVNRFCRSGGGVELPVNTIVILLVPVSRSCKKYPDALQIPRPIAAPAPQVPVFAALNPCNARDHRLPKRNPTISARHPLVRDKDATSVLDDLPYPPDDVIIIRNSAA